MSIVPVSHVPVSHVLSIVLVSNATDYAPKSSCNEAKP